MSPVYDDLDEEDEEESIGLRDLRGGNSYRKTTGEPFDVDETSKLDYAGHGAFK